MRNQNVKALVLKAINQADKNKIYSLLSPELGKVSAMGRGVRKITSRRAGNLDSLNVISVKLSSYDGKFYSIDEVKLLKSFGGIKKDLTKLKLAYYLLELIHKTYEASSGEDAEVFGMLVKVLNAIDVSESVEVAKVLVHFFEFEYLKLTGYNLNFSKCLKCGADLDFEADNRFSMDFGGCLCSNCFGPGKSVSKNLLEVFKRFEAGKSVSGVSGELVAELDELMRGYMGYIFEVRFKSNDF